MFRSIDRFISIFFVPSIKLNKENPFLKMKTLPKVKLENISKHETML